MKSTTKYALVTCAFFVFSTTARAEVNPFDCLGEPNVELRGGTRGGVQYAWGIPANQIENCINRNGWPVAMRGSLGGISEWSFHKKYYGQQLRQSGVNLSPIDNFISSKDEATTVTLYWRRWNKDTIDATILRDMESTNGRRFSNEEKDKIADYIEASLGVRRHYLEFNRGLGVVNSRMLTEWWQVLPAIEANRPVITPRALTRQEQNQARSISAEYIRTANAQTAANLSILIGLAQSGDRIAMIALRDALTKAPPWDVYREYMGLSIDTNPLKRLSQIMAAQWTAQIWQMYGYEDAGRKSMNICINGMFGQERDQSAITAKLVGNEIIGTNSDGQTFERSSEVCGFTLNGAFSNRRENGAGNGRLISVLPRGATNITYWDNSGSGWFERSKDFYITGVTFNPILGDAAQREQKFQNHLSARRGGLMYRPDGTEANITPSIYVLGEWFKKYATETGRLYQIDNADATASATIRTRLENTMRTRLESWNSALAKFNSEAPNPTQGTIDDLQRNASLLGGNYWREYERLVPNRYGAAPVQNTTSYSAPNQGAGSQRVEVRTYDAGGNYTGSLTTSAVWADIMKMGSGAPR